MADDRTYIRVHDGMDDHPKIVGLSDGAFRLLMRAWSYCSRQLTDGRLPDAAWRSRGSARARSELVVAGLAHLPGFVCHHPDCPTPPPGDVQMHDYLEHQRSAEEVAELKRKRAEAGSKGGRAKASAMANAKQVPQQPASKTVPSTETETEEEQENSSKGGSHVSRGSASTPPVFPDHCHEHADNPVPPKCGGCAKQKQLNQTRPTLALVGPHNPATVPHCGQCDATRHRETPFGVIRCPECHPRAEESA